MAGGVDLPDVNVWMALSFAGHPHHRRARAYWYQESAERIAFCRLTALAFVRLSMQASAMGGQPLSPAAAWRAYRSYRALPEVLLAAEPETCEDVLERWISRERFPAALLTDAYLAAFAMEARCRLVTFDAGFQRFEGLEALRLVP